MTDKANMMQAAPLNGLAPKGQQPISPIIQQTQSYKIRIHLTDDKLSIQAILADVSDRYYTRSYGNADIQQSLLDVFQDIDIMFQCFKCPFTVIAVPIPDDQNMGVELQVGQYISACLDDRQQEQSANKQHPSRSYKVIVKLWAHYQIKNRQVTKQALIQLQQVQATRQQIASKRLSYLSEQVTQLQQQYSQIEVDSDQIDPSIIKYQDCDSQGDDVLECMSLQVGVLRSVLKQVDSCLEMISPTCLQLIQQTNKIINQNIQLTQTGTRLASVISAHTPPTLQLNNQTFNDSCNNNQKSHDNVQNQAGDIGSKSARVGGDIVGNVQKQHKQHRQHRQSQMKQQIQYVCISSSSEQDQPKCDNMQKVYKMMKKISKSRRSQLHQRKKKNKQQFRNNITKYNQPTKNIRIITKPNQKSASKQKQVHVSNNKQYRNTHTQIPKNSHNMQKNSRNSIEIVKKPGSSQFDIKNNIITYKGVNKRNQLIINRTMQINRDYSYRIRVRKLTLKDMYVGIVTARNSKSKFTNDVISYLGVDGEIWDGKPQEVKIGEGFKQDDVVQVLIRDNEIVWKVNGKLQAKYKSNKIRAGVQFLPFFEMCYEGDSIEWLN